MKRTLLCILLLSLLPVFAVAQDKGPDVIKFDAKMGTVTFNHLAHQGNVAECSTCHHVENSFTCRNCHGDKPSKIDGALAKKFKDAAHAKCTGCHDELADAGKPAGPGKRGCKECHVR